MKAIDWTIITVDRIPKEDEAMTSYRIVSDAGVDMGTYEGDSPSRAAELAVALVRESTMGRLRCATIDGTLADVLGARESVLRGRLGRWTTVEERDALYLVESAVTAAIESPNFQDHDDAEIDEDDVIARIQASERGGL